MNIGQQIAKYRKEKRLTQEQLGEAVGVTGRSVSKWEVGLSSPGVDLIPSIAATLGITLDELFGIQPKEKQKTSPRSSGRRSPRRWNRSYPTCLKKIWTN